MRFQWLPVVLAFSALGCAKPIQFVPATVPIENHPFVILGKAHGVACSRRVLFIPFQFNEGIEKAYRDAIEDVEGAQGLIEVSIDAHETEVLPLVPVFYASHCTEVSGKAIRFVRDAPWVVPLPPGAAPPPGVPMPAPGPPPAPPPPR